MHDTYSSKDTRAHIKAAAEALKAARRVVLGAHPLMDGDALGSVFTLAHALRAAGKDVLALTQDVDAGKYAFMQDGDRIHIEVKGRDGQSVFGAIDQSVRVALASPLSISVICDRRAEARVTSSLSFSIARTSWFSV